MIDLRDVTFIIPIKIEHEDRYRNAKTVLNYLNANVFTNVFIFEIAENKESNLDFIRSLANLNIKHWVEDQTPVFHRTRYLNIMLDDVETPVVVNYDIDVVLSPSNMAECRDLLVKGEADVIYPYENGNGQGMVMKEFNYQGFEKSGYDINFLNGSDQISRSQSECGHCIFFNTSIYKKYSGENEHFISYGPEDKERCFRFQALGCKVIWRPGEYVYHFEHYRGNDSWVTNPHFSHNWGVFEDLKKKSAENLHAYYKSPDYSRSYKTISK